MSSNHRRIHRIVAMSYRAIRLLTGPLVVTHNAFQSKAKGFQLIFQGFPRFREQHNACEFLHHCLALARAAEGSHRWEARLRSSHRVEILDHGTLNQPIHLTLTSQSLQGLVDDWHHQHRMHGLVQASQCLFLQICKYGSSDAANNTTPIPLTPGARILMPVLENSQDTVGLLIPYRLLFVVVHEGNSVNRGHYQSVLSAGGNFIVTNDASINALLPQHRYERLYKNCYLIGLIKD